jgi:hypothetical protein
MYIVFRLHPDGDSYSLFQTEDEAMKMFNTTDMIPEGRVVVAKIENVKDFGWGNYGDMYGAEVLADSENEIDEVKELQKIAGIKK